MSRRCLVLVVAVVLGATTVVTAATSTVRIAHRWNTDNPFHLGFAAAIQGFEVRYPDVKVQLDSGYTDDKYKVEIAAGTPPDVILVATSVSWGANGFLEPLNKYVEQSKISAEDFVPAAWQQNVWDGILWALPLQIDPNFPLIWNKALFASAGLDTNRGPETLQDYDEYAEKLELYYTDGRLKQIGAIPWGVYGNANTIFTWGWIFGGEFYDYQLNRITATDADIVSALEYLRDYYGRLNDDLFTLRQGLPPGVNTFTGNREGMRFTVMGELYLIQNNFPDLEIGISKMPYKVSSGVENPAWIGGWSLGLAKGAANPDDGWKLIEFLTATAEGTKLFSDASKWIPGYLKSPALQEFGADPYWRVYADIAVTTTRYQPAIPQKQVYVNELSRIFPLVLKGEKMPLDALREVTEIVEAKIKEAAANN